MTDLEITRLCAEAMDFGAELSHGVFAIYEKGAGGTMIQHIFNPLHDDAQAMALVKKLGLDIHCREDMNGWYVGRGRLHEGLSIDADLNRAICKNVSDIQAQAQKPGAGQA